VCKLKKFFDVVLKAQRKITAFLMLALIVTVTTQIVARMIFTLSTPWTEELAKYLLIWIAFIGSVGALIKGEHLMVDILHVKFPPRLKKYARIVNDIISLFFTGFLLIYGVQLCANPIIRRSLTPAMQMPRVWLYLVLPISMGFMVLYSGYDLYDAIRSLGKDEETKVTEVVADESKTLDELEAEEAAKK